MKYIRQPNGELIAYVEDSEAYLALSSLPQDKRPEFLSGDDVAAELAAELRHHATRMVTAFANTIRERITKSKHYLQSARWPLQLPAAQAIIAGTASDLDTEMMALEARLRARGETPLQLAQKVVANSRVFTLVGAAVDGIERAALDALDAHTGTEPAGFEQIVDSARTTARTELLAIFTPLHGEAAAQAMVTELAGPALVAVEG